MRQGSSLYIEPVGEVFNHGAAAEQIWQDGSLTFRLQQLGKEGEVLRESGEKTERYYVDPDVPAAQIEADGYYDGEILYAAEDAGISFAAPPDGQSGLAEVAYRILPCTLEGGKVSYVESQDWIPCGRQEELWLPQEGYYCVFVRTRDRVGNLAFAQSSVICVDRTPPVLEISGVSDQTANSGEVTVSLLCRDSAYRMGSLQVTLRGKNNGKIIQVKESGEDEKGARLVYGGIPIAREYDDIYELTASAQDLAGNQIRETITFSVNRHGSVYDLSEATRQALKEYYLQNPVDVVFCETNVDYVGNVEIFCRHDGEMRILKENTDYFVLSRGSDDSWKQYEYQILADQFQEEGVYELLMTTSDAANHVSDTGIQEKRVTFVVDRTPPSCVIAGIEQEEICREEKKRVRLLISDNTRLHKMKIFHNSRVIQELGEEELLQTGGFVELEFEPEADWQTLQVFLEDAAGNQFWTEERAFFLQKDGAEEIPVYEKSMKSVGKPAASGTRTLQNQTQAAYGETSDNPEWKILFLAAGAGAFIWALCLQVFSHFTSRKR